MLVSDLGAASEFTLWCLTGDPVKFSDMYFSFEKIFIVAENNLVIFYVKLCNV